MPDSERLPLLRQQRALLLQQLEMLEKEIAREAAVPGAPLAPSPAASTVIPSKIPVPRAVAPAAEAEADALLAQLVASESDSKSFSKSGCLLIFGAVMFAAIALVGVVYYFFYR